MSEVEREEKEARVILWFKKRAERRDIGQVTRDKMNRKVPEMNPGVLDDYYKIAIKDLKKWGTN